MSAAVLTDFASIDSTAAIKRYQDGYRAAEAVVIFGKTVRLGGIFTGGVIFVGGLVEFILNPAEHSGFPVVFASLIGCAFLQILISQAVAMGLRGQGNLLQATLDSDVNSSPFLTNPQRAQAMSLEEQPPVPSVLPVWTE
jgi:hypothetical protein